MSEQQARLILNTEAAEVLQEVLDLIDESYQHTLDCLSDVENATNDTEQAFAISYTEEALVMFHHTVSRLFDVLNIPPEMRGSFISHELQPVSIFTIDEETARYPVSQAGD